MKSRPDAIENEYSETKSDHRGDVGNDRTSEHVRDLALGRGRWQLSGGAYE